MKKILVSILLISMMSCALFGCVNISVDITTTSSDETEETIRETETETEAPEPEITWSYNIKIETSGDEYSTDDGVRLLTVSYERPSLEIVCDGDAKGATPPGEMQRICDAFNERFKEISVNSDHVAELFEQAKYQNEMMSKGSGFSFIEYTEETTVRDHRIDGDLADVVIHKYGYYGGVHGGSSRIGYHFDLKNGVFFDLNDVTDDLDNLKKAISNEINTQIYSMDIDYLEPRDFTSVVGDTGSYDFAAGDDSLTVIFNEYEIAPYAYGIIEFEIPYSVISRYFNGDGERLLDPSLEAKCLSWFYEANEMWYWFEGSMPCDYNDTRAEKLDGYDNYCARVDIPGVNSIADLKNVLMRRFDAGLAESRVDSFKSMLREIDGKLYAFAAGRGGDMRIRSIDYVASVNADGAGGKVVATIIWQDYDNSAEKWVETGETSDVIFPFDITDNGAIFTDFSTLW